MANTKQRGGKGHYNGKGKGAFKGTQNVKGFKGENQGFGGLRIGGGNIPDSNDPIWYLNSPDLVNAIANVPFKSIIGFLYNLNPDAINQDELFGLAEADITAPSVLAISYVNSIGVTEDAASPVNMAAQAILSYMRSKAKVRNTYEKTDLMVYLLGNDSAYSAIATAAKAMRCARVFSVRNREVGAQWIEAMGIEVPDLRYHLKDYVLRLNILIDKLAQMRVPKGYPLFDRHLYMTKNIFRDVPDNKLTAQTYLFAPQGFHVFDNMAEGGSALIYRHWWAPGEPLRKMSELLDLIEEMVARLVDDEDTGNMSGDIEAVFGVDGCYTLGHVSEDEMIETIYDSGMQAQIENLRTYPVDEGSLNVTQIGDENLNSILKFKPAILKYNTGNGETISAGQIGALLRPYLNMHWENPTPSDIMYTTRCMCSVDSYWLSARDLTDEATELEIFLSSTGAEICTKMAIYEKGRRYDLESTMDDLSAETAPALYALNSFDWHPIVNVIDLLNRRFVSTFVDLDNYTVLDSSTLKAVNDLALLSLWRIPTYGNRTTNV